MMSSEIEHVNTMQQLQQTATDLRHEQRIALELLQLGYSDIEIAESIGVRRETVWRWKHRDPDFQAALRERRATMTDAAAERLRGLLDQAVSVVLKSLSSRDADPKMAMSLLGSLGVLERSRELGRAEEAPAGRVEAQEADGDAELEGMLEAVEAESGGFEHRVGEGE